MDSPERPRRPRVHLTRCASPSCRDRDAAWLWLEEAERLASQTGNRPGSRLARAIERLRATFEAAG